MPKSYQVGGTRYDFPDNYNDDQVRDILIKQGVIKSPAPVAAPPSQPSAEQPNAPGNPAWEYLKGAASMLNPIPILQSMYEHTAPTPDGSVGENAKKLLLGNALGPIGGILPGVLEAHKQQFLKAVEAAHQGRYSEAVGHGVASAVPVVGPAAAQVAETLGGVPEMPPDKTSKYDGPVTPPNPARAAGEATALLAGPKIMKGAAKTAGMAGDVIAGMEGKATGAGGEAIRTMFKNPSPEAIAAMRGKVQPTDIVNDVKAALDNAMEKRSADYVAQQSKLKDVSAPVDISNADKVIDNGLKRFRVDNMDAWPEPEGPTGGYSQEQMQRLIKSLREDESGNISDGTNNSGKQRLDFSRSPVSAAAQGDIVAVTKLVKNWPDRTPLGIDALIRRVSDYYTDNGQARAYIQAVKKSLQSDLAKQHPEYAKMVGDYAQASELISQAQRELSTGNKNPGVAVRKLTYALNQNNNFRQMLLEGLQQFSDTDLKGTIAGQHLNPVMPRGIVGPMHGAAALASLGSGHPGALAYLMLASPRLIGELTAASGKVAKAVGPIANTPAVTRGVPLYNAGQPTDGQERTQP